jgi:hypothetical protein
LILASKAGVAATKVGDTAATFVAAVVRWLRRCNPIGRR